MKILVTGGAGFIGSAVIRNIIKNTEDRIINIDKLTYASNLGSLKDITSSDKYMFKKVDICNEKDLVEIFGEYKPDAVMHLAAESHVDRSIDDPKEFIKTNIFGTFNLLEVSRHYWEALDKKLKSKFRFHHISTDEVFGDLQKDDKKFTEQTPYKPSSPYSASKASSDHLVRSWNRTYELPIIITNCSNNYGPYQHDEKLIPLMISNALNEKKLPVYGNGEQIRDWLYVEDHAEALYCVLKNGEIGQTYNIGGDNQVKNIEVVKEICSVLDTLKPRLNNKSYSDLISFVKDRPGHDIRYAMNISKIQEELNWKPKESFKTGLKKTIIWNIEQYS
tara:strand:- start:19599 stop:20600 length:1002 start_codon:yes stop_codon:yes gene_type:complete